MYTFIDKMNTACALYHLNTSDCTLGEPVFESFSLSVTVGHTCHNKYIWKVSS